MGHGAAVSALRAAAWVLASVGLMGRGAAVLLAGVLQVSLGAEHCAHPMTAVPVQ